jgi:hypothetical protein
MKNSDKQNATFLGKVAGAEPKDTLFDLIKTAAALPDSAMGSQQDFEIRETARRHVRTHEAEVKYFKGLENGIEDIDAVNAEWRKNNL